VCADLERITERFEKANNRALRAQTIEDWEAAEAERRDIAGEYWGATDELAQLGLMLVRLAAEHYPDALRIYLVEIMRPELEAITGAIARLEGRR
jgi:hypothetical protein